MTLHNLTPDERRELEALEKMTPGPWRVDIRERLVVSALGKSILTELELAAGGSNKPKTDMDYLCVVVNSARRRLETISRMRGALERIANADDNLMPYYEMQKVARTALEEK